MTALTDAQLVSGVLAGDRDSFAAVYDRYADRLHDFAYSMLRHREDAADAVADAFVTTAERLEQLRDPERLRPWLYAVTRRECLRRLKARSRTSYGGDDDLVDLPDQAAAPETVAEQASLRALVWDAAAGLNERDRAMLDLHLRQGLDGAELGEAMGMSADNAYVGLSRLRDQVERSIGALLVARTSAQDCSELGGVLGDWDGDFTPLVRKRVARHVDRCAKCNARRAVLASPAALLAGVPAFAAPALLRDRVLEDTRLVSALSSRASSGGGPGSPPGSPPPAAPAEGGRRRTRVAALAALLALVVVLAGIGYWQQAGGDDPQTVAEDVAVVTTEAVTPSASLPGQSTTQVTPTLSPVAEPTTEPTPEVTPTPSPEVTPTPTPSETATTPSEPSPTPATPSATADEPTPQAQPGRLVVSPSSLDLGTTGTGRTVLTNKGGKSVSFDVVAGQGWLTVSLASGTLAPGKSRSVTVSADRTQLPEGSTTGGLTVSWDKGDIPVSVTAARETPPTIGAVSEVRTACGNNGRTVYVSVPVDDESGVASASIAWSGPASGTSALRLTGTVWAGAIGPFPVGGVAQLEVVATDTRGNTGRQTQSFPVDPCPQ